MKSQRCLNSKNREEVAWRAFYCLGCGSEICCYKGFWKRSIFTFKTNFTRKKGRSHPYSFPFQVQISRLESESLSVITITIDGWCLSKILRRRRKLTSQSPFSSTDFNRILKKKMIDSRNLKLELVQNTRQFMEKINFNLASKTRDCFEPKKETFSTSKKDVDIWLFTDYFQRKKFSRFVLNIWLKEILTLFAILLIFNLLFLRSKTLKNWRKFQLCWPINSAQLKCQKQQYRELPDPFT